MAYQSSVFPQQEPSAKQVDCRPTAPDVVIYYDGTTTAVPLLKQGAITFPGAQINVSGSGIAGLGKDFAIDYDALPKRGLGAKIRACVTPQKQLLRFFCKNNPCSGAATDFVSLEIKPITDCNYPLEWEYENPIIVTTSNGCNDTCCEKLNSVAKRWNSQCSQLGTASVVQVGSDYALQIESLYAGVLRFHVKGVHGLTDPQLIVSGLPATYTSDTVRDWLSPALLPAECVGAGTCVKVVELFPTVSFAGESAGVMTSNLSTQTQSSSIQTTQTVAFITANNTNGDAARTALLTILEGGGSGYLDRLDGQTAVDTPMYYYTVVRTDAGSATNYATLGTDYTAALAYWRVGYVGGKSYYEIITASATAPSVVANSGDVITAGRAIVPDQTYVSTCP